MAAGRACLDRHRWLLARLRPDSIRPRHRHRRRRRARRGLRRLCARARDVAWRRSDDAQSDRDAGVAAALGQRVGQPGWIDRARLRRPLRVLRGQPRPPGPDEGQGVRAPAGVNRRERLRRQQREHQSARDDGRVPAGARAAVAGVPSVGHPDGARGRLLDAEDDRRSRHVRPAGAGRHRLLEDARGRRLPCGSGSRRIRAEGRFRRPARALGLRPHPRRRRQRDRAGAEAARRRVLLPRLRLRPPHGLAQPEERPRAGRVGQLPRPRRPVRRQRHPADQARADRLPGARACLAAFRRTEEDQPGRGAPDHAGVHGPAAARLLPRPDVEGGARFRSAGGWPRDARESNRQRPHVQTTRRGIRRRVERRRLADMARAPTWRWRTSTGSAVSPGILR